MENISPFLGTLIGNIIVAIGIVLVVYIISFLKNKINKYIEYITAVTVGLLLGIIFLGFLPELSSEAGFVGKEMGIYILIGIFIFYLFELFLHWHHCKDLNHKDSCNSNHHLEHKNGILMFGGTLLHNGFHGIVLFSAFSIDFYFGMVTTVAVLLHSLPQNIVNYIMNHKNIKYAYIAGFGGIIGALLTYPFSNFLTQNKFYILAIITGGLLYTALADIVPEFSGKLNTKKKLIYFIFIIIGILSFVVFEELNGHEHEEHTAETHKEH